jgi:ribbon-helix-helix CopG family protein
MTTITVSVPADVVKIIDELRERELLSRAVWLRHEITLAIRCQSDQCRGEAALIAAAAAALSVN